jgi:hypothetical protein
MEGLIAVLVGTGNLPIYQCPYCRRLQNWILYKLSSILITPYFLQKFGSFSTPLHNMTTVRKGFIPVHYQQVSHLSTTTLCLSRLVVIIMLSLNFSPKQDEMKCCVYVIKRQNRYNISALVRVLSQ